MSYLRAALKLEDELSRCKGEKNSKLWKDVRSAFDKITGELDSICAHFESKDTWMNRGGRLERTIRFLVVYGYGHRLTQFSDFLFWMKSAVNCCCVALERIDLISTSMCNIQPYECLLYIALSEQCPSQIYQDTLGCLIHHQRCSTEPAAVRRDSEMLLGFMLISG